MNVENNSNGSHIKDTIELMNQSSIEDLKKDVDMKDHNEMQKLPSLSPMKSQAARIEEEGGVISETFFG